ncbi:MAG: hypothetical protein AMXMBFR58_16050 [Phycisphaerae bacterium]
MATQNLTRASRELTASTHPQSPVSLPALIAAGGKTAAGRFLEFFAADIRNPHTRRAYFRACAEFLGWCEQQKIRSLQEVGPVVIAAYVESLLRRPSRTHEATSTKPTAKQALAAIRRLFDYLVLGHIVHTNPALSVRGPRHSTAKGRTSPLDCDQVRELFASIDASQLAGKRDRALIAVMAYGFARIGAVVRMRVQDYVQRGKRWHLRLHEKNGKVIDLPAHHTAEMYLDDYIAAAGICDQRKGPLFRSMDRWGRMSTSGLTENDAFRMVRRRAVAAGLPGTTGNHTFRATSATTYLANGGKLEHAQRMMGHSDPRTTKMYDHTSDRLTLAGC